MLTPTARHDNVVRLLGVVLEDDRFVKYLVFELATEGSVEAFIARQLSGRGTTALPFDVVQLVMRDTLCGLCFLHNGGPHPVLHRDLKPANMLVTRRRPDGDVDLTDMSAFVAKLGDLGSAKALSTLSPSLATGVETPFTLAPEVLEGSYGTAADMFAWGMSMCMVVMQALGCVSDPGETYCGNRSAMVADAVSIVRRHRPMVADGLEQCCIGGPCAARPSAASMFVIVVTNDRASVPSVTSTPSTSLKSLVAVYVW